jgi:hypothetical protein
MGRLLSSPYSDPVAAGLDSAKKGLQDHNDYNGPQFERDRGRIKRDDSIKAFNDEDNED